MFTVYNVIQICYTYIMSKEKVHTNLNYEKFQVMLKY